MPTLPLPTDWPTSWTPPTRDIAWWEARHFEARKHVATVSIWDDGDLGFRRYNALHDMVPAPVLRHLMALHALEKQPSGQPVVKPPLGPPYVTCVEVGRLTFEVYRGDTLTVELVGGHPAKVTVTRA